MHVVIAFTVYAVAVLATLFVLAHYLRVPWYTNADFAFVLVIVPGGIMLLKCTSTQLVEAWARGFCGDNGVSAGTSPASIPYLVTHTS